MTFEEVPWERVIQLREGMIAWPNVVDTRKIVGLTVDVDGPIRAGEFILECGHRIEFIDSLYGDYRVCDECRKERAERNGAV